MPTIGLPLPRRARLDASNACQLRCPGCSATSGLVKQHLGMGNMNFADFKAFLEDNPQLRAVELANWGEIFLNKELPRMIRFAHDRGVQLSAETGANLNHISDECIEAMVRYRFGTLVVSIDGATQQTYQSYRIGGNLEQVLANIERINAAKTSANSEYPLLVWQFVTFKHNRHEIAKARETANRLGMSFYTKPNTSVWEVDGLSEPRETGSQPQRMEKTPRPSQRKGPSAWARKQAKGVPCLQLWEQPQITWDGTVTGCNCNAGELGNYGNAFEEGLDAIFNGEKMSAARAMLMGKAAPREDIPCASCPKFEIKVQTGAYVTPLQVRVRRLLGRAGVWMLGSPRVYLKAKDWFSRRTRQQA